MHAAFAHSGNQTQAACAASKCTNQDSIGPRLLTQFLPNSIVHKSQAIRIQASFRRNLFEARSKMKNKSFFIFLKKRKKVEISSFSQEPLFQVFPNLCKSSLAELFQQLRVKKCSFQFNSSLNCFRISIRASCAMKRVLMGKS